MTAVQTGSAVLLVEDNHLLAMLTTEMLVDAGYHVTHAEDGDQAVALLKNEKFDILISDIVMPGGMSGIELIHRVELMYPTIRYILVTGFGDSLSLPAEFRNRVIHKPYDANTLLKAIAHLRKPPA